jgi:hypothetical protein
MRSCRSIPLMSYPTVSFLPPLALLASWRLNFPAFTHDTDRIEYLRTVYRPWPAHKMNRQDAKDAKEIERLEQVRDALVPIHTAHVLSTRVFSPPLALLASWRLNSPAFTPDTDRIEYLRTVCRPWPAHKMNRQDAKDAKEIERLEQVRDALVPIHTAHVLSNRVFSLPLGALGVLAVEFPCLHA